jgi:hypothetical protein
MTKSATRRASLAGGCKRACNQGAPTNLKSLHHKPMAGAAFGAGLSIIYRKTYVQGIADIQTDGFASRY